MIKWNVTFDEASFRSYGLDLNSIDLDPSKQTSLRDLLTTDAQLAGQEWGNYLSGPDFGDADIDVQIIADKSGERFWVRPDPIDLSSPSKFDYVPVKLDATVKFEYPPVKLDATVWEHRAAFEIDTGIDGNTILAPDIVIHVNPEDLKNELWLNPDLTLPADKADAVAAFAHEIGHTLAFSGLMNASSGTFHIGDSGKEFKSTFDEHVVRHGDALFFEGENAKSVYGGPVPLNWQAGVNNSDPYHLEGDIPALKSDLMSSGTTVRFGGKHYEVSSLDLAILADCGVTVAVPFDTAPSTIDTATAPTTTAPSAGTGANLLQNAPSSKATDVNKPTDVPGLSFERTFNENEPNSSPEQANDLGKLYPNQPIHISGHLNWNSDTYDYFNYTVSEAGTIDIKMHRGDEVIYDGTFTATQENEPFQYYGDAWGDADFDYDTYITLSPASRVDQQLTPDNIGQTPLGQPPAITGYDTFQEGDPQRPRLDRRSFGFRGVKGSGWAEENHPFSDPSYGRVGPGTVAYPFNHLATTDSPLELDVEVWVYDKEGLRSDPVTVHLKAESQDQKEVSEVADPIPTDEVPFFILGGSNSELDPIGGTAM